jgi:hypothetical protein
MVGLITGIVEINDGPTPLGGPTRTPPVLIKVKGGGRGEAWQIEISQDAAAELTERLSRFLQHRGSR